MPLPATQAAIIIAVIALGTCATRFLPFLLFPSSDKTPGIVVYLGKVLPYAAMGMLVVYCLKSVSVFAPQHGIPEILAVAGVVALHLWKRSTLLSIAAGTALYMLLIQVL